MNEQNNNLGAIPNWGFGMAPLKLKTENLNNEAVTELLLELTIESEEMGIDPESISVIKGLINRIIRQDQWDWFTIFYKFGEPDKVKLKKIPSVLTEFRKAVICNKAEEYEKYKQELISLRLVYLCELYLGKRKEWWNLKDGSGYLYILSKRKSPDNLIIGVTTQSIWEHVHEINSEKGVFEPYSVRGLFRVKDAKKAKERIYIEFNKHRTHENQEYFKLNFGYAERKITDYLKEDGLLTK